MCVIMQHGKPSKAAAAEVDELTSAWDVGEATATHRLNSL